MSNTTYTWGLTNELVESWAYAQVFTPEECAFIIDIGKALNPIEAKINTDELDVDTRKSNIAWVAVEDHTKWIFERCTTVVNDINERFFKFDLHRIQSLQFTAYDENGSFYGNHIDLMPSTGTADHRKLSFSIQLSSPDDYEGGELHLHYKKTPDVGKKDLGMATLFPSYCLHEVTPITSGKRYALVGWVAGPRFK